MNKPVFVINFKAYEQGFGEQGMQLAKTIEEVAKIKGLQVIICVPATEVHRISHSVAIQVYAQHSDPIEPGQRTGWIAPQMLVAAGARGALINHSEHKLGEDTEKAVQLAKEAGLKVIVCAKDALEVKILRNLPVQFIAVEPPELIGGDVAVSTAKPELIAASVKHCPDKLLVGAGIKKRVDVQKSMELGARGVLVASGIVKAKNPKDTLMEFFTGW